MAEETITILKVGTDEAVRNIADLKENIKQYKAALNELEIGTEDYAKVLQALQVNQAALKNAMHATTTAGDDEADSFAATARAAQGLGTSYNALVKQMADLDQQFRATEDAAKRADIGAQIKAINEQLKDLDAARGKFGRNVGDYFGQALTENMKSIVQDLPSGLSGIKKGLDDTTKSLGLMGKQPILGIIALLAPIINDIVAGLKENETALNAIEKAMKALDPVFKLVENVIQKIAEGLAKAVDWVLELGANSGIEFKNIVAGAVGVGNALLQFILTPIRNIIDGAKGLGNVLQQVFKGQFKEAAQTAKTAIKDIGDNFKEGFSFKKNFELGKQVGEQFAAGLSSTRKKAGDAAKGIRDEVKKELLATWDDMEKERKRREGLLAESRQMAADEAREFAALLEQTDAELTASIQAELDAQIAAEWEAKEREKEINQQRMASFLAFASALSDVTSTIADIYEADSEADEQAAQKAKALRTASAIISTLGGAVSAYTSTWAAAELPLSVKAVLAPVNAAAVLAAGYAQVKQINAVKVGSGAGGASVTPPAFSPAVQQVRSITGASEEARLDRMARDSRVYLVYSDIEVAQHAQRVRVAETAF